MPLPPLRAVILDNDETTGSYGLVFSICSVLEQWGTISVENLEKVLQRLAQFMITHNIFRPGLRSLLLVLSRLRELHKIDAVIMYTNQMDTGGPFSIPYAIAYMMEYLISKHLFDYVLTRPTQPDSEGQYTKQFRRVLDLVPDRPLDIRSLMFIDDLAHPEFVKADGVPKRLQSEGSWLKIEPYHRALSIKEFDNAFQLCILGVFGQEGAPLYQKILKTYCQFVPQTTSVPNARPFLSLTLELQKRYGYVSVIAPLSVYIKHRAHPTVENGRPKPSQTNGGETQGEHNTSQ